jgi:hypothetical protein
MCNQVYWIRQSVDDEGERPDLVTYGDPRFKTGEGFREFQTNCCVAAGMSGYPADKWFVPELCAFEKGKTDIEAWDYYMCATFGAFSKRAMESLKPAFSDRFSALPAHLEGHEYFCLHCRSRVDCLDEGASEIDYFDDFDPPQAMEIKSHVFRKDMLSDPMLFAIPVASFSLYCTESVLDIAAKAGLRGFDFRLVN